MNPNEPLEFPNLDALKAALENKTDALELLENMTGTKTETLATLIGLTDKWSKPVAEVQDEV